MVKGGATAAYLGFGQNGFFHVLIVGHVNRGECHTKFGRDLPEITVGAAVHVVTAHHVIAELEQLDDGRGGRQTGRVRQTVFGALQGRYTLLQYLSNGIPASGVLESLCTVYTYDIIILL